MASDSERLEALQPTTGHPAPPEVPPQDGVLRPLVPAPVPAADDLASQLTCQRSGRLQRPFDEIRRRAVRAGEAVTELEHYKLAMRKYAPVQKGRAGLPWPGQW